MQFPLEFQQKIIHPLKAERISCNVILESSAKTIFLGSYKNMKFSCTHQKIFLDWLTQYNDCYVTAHDVDCHHHYSVQEQVEVPVVPLGHTVTNL